MKEGTLITSTKTSHKIKSTAKKITGSMMFVTEDFTTTAPKPTLKESHEPVKETVEGLRLVGGAFELASVEQHFAFLTDHLALLLEESFYRPPELSVDNVVDAPGGLRVQTSKLLETAASPGFKTLQTHTYAMLDGGVVTDVEMQERLLFESAPIAAVHRCAVAHVESARDDFPLALGQHQTNVRRKPTVNLIEKFRREVLAAVVMPIDMALVEAKHGTHLRSREISPFEGPDNNSPLSDFPSLPFNLITSVTAKTTEIVVERVKILILPVKLETCSGKKPDLFQSLPLLDQAKVHMN